MRWPYTLAAVAVLTGAAAGQAARPGRAQARSMVISKLGIVAASQTLAAQAGAQILAEGGSAADAAIAANATLGVVEPMMNGMGGDLFATVWDAQSGKISGLNASGWAPAGLTPALMRRKGFTQMPQSGIDSVTVPGAVRGWQALHDKFGKLPWAALFQPAIYYAEHGFPVTEWIAGQWQESQAKLAADANARRVYLIAGHAPVVGEVFRNPAYASALRTIARQGPDAFYTGAIARAILATSRRLGGVMTAADLSAYQPQWVTPLTTTYRGWTVYELPPNTQGIAALEMLNLFSHFPLGAWGFSDPRSWYVETEAQKLAYADLARYDGDPRLAHVPTAGLIAPAYAAQRVRAIAMDHAGCDVAPGDPSRFNSDTVYLSAVDAEGNIVSLIQSLYLEFGSGVVVDHYGFALQNRGALFVLTPGHPDVLAPHKRPFHTLIPGLMQKGSLHIGFGIMGGLNQAQAHAQFVSDIADHGMNIQAALEAPRFTNPNFGGCTFFVEDRVPEAARRLLRQRGDTLTLGNDYSDVVGGGQAVLYDTATGVKFGASDPRKDGEAVPQPAPIPH